MSGEHRSPLIEGSKTAHTRALRADAAVARQA